MESPPRLPGRMKKDAHGGSSAEDPRQKKERKNNQGNRLVSFFVCLCVAELHHSNTCYKAKPLSQDNICINAHGPAGSSIGIGPPKTPPGLCIVMAGSSEISAAASSKVVTLLSVWSESTGVSGAKYVFSTDIFARCLLRTKREEMQEKQAPQCLQVNLYGKRDMAHHVKVRDPHPKSTGLKLKIDLALTIAVESRNSSTFVGGVCEGSQIRFPKPSQRSYQLRTNLKDDTNQGIPLECI